MCVVLALMKTSKSTENSETKETYAAWAIKFSCPDPKREGFDGQRIFVARQIIVAGHPCGQWFHITQSFNEFNCTPVIRLKIFEHVWTLLNMFWVFKSIDPIDLWSVDLQVPKAAWLRWEIWVVELPLGLGCVLDWALSTWIFTSPKRFGRLFWKLFWDEREISKAVWSCIRRREEFCIKKLLSNERSPFANLANSTWIYVDI